MNNKQMNNKNNNYNYYYNYYQEYLARLQAQKNGSGAQAFDFLDKKVSTAGEIDNGFTQAQLQIMEDTEQVLFIYLLFISYFYFLFLFILFNSI